MAKVKNPLYSLSASGSVGAITYHLAHQTEQREFHRIRRGTSFTAVYPPRILSGVAYVRKKPGIRRDLRRIHREPSTPNASPEKQKQIDFQTASVIAGWLTRNNITIYLRDPTQPPPITYPWWDRKYLSLSDEVELQRFPGQRDGFTTAFRRRTRSRLQNKNFIMKQIIGAGGFRLQYFIDIFLKLTNEERILWQTQLPQMADLLASIRRFRPVFEGFEGIIPLVIVGSFLLGALPAPPLWSREGWMLNLEPANTIRPADDPIRVKWEEFHASQNNTREVPIAPWQRRPD